MEKVDAETRTALGHLLKDFIQHEKIERGDNDFFIEPFVADGQ